jgi:DNA-binding helix-hairpin-helix protein with protein kinase domain
VLLEVQIATATQSHWRAVLLDCDSFQLEATGVRYFCPVGRPHYTAPELIGADLSRTWREPSSDAFALAVLIYQLLLHDHPYDSALIVDTPEMDVTARISRGLYPHAACPASGVLPGPFRPAPAHIDAAMDAAFRRGLMGWPQLRPTAAEWVVLLRDLYNRVVPCAINRRHHHVADQACLWCTVERRLGRSLSTYSEAPVRASNQLASAVPTAHTANANHPLLPALQQQIMQARELVLHRASLIDVALQLQATLQQLRNRYRDPVAWLDQQAGERRLLTWRNRLSRWLGHHDKIKRRQEQVDRLTALANKTVQLAAEGVATLDAQREALLQCLAAAPTAILADRLPLVDEPQALEVLIDHAREQQRQRWLEQQLASQPIKSWNVPGFGNQRMALLERHGLTRADQVWRQPNTLSAIPGIGASLQKSLLQKLEQVSSELQDGWPSANAGDGLTLADCLEPSLLALIKGQRTQMTVLEQTTNELSAACRDLEQRLEARLLERNALRQQLRGLF